MHATKKKFGMKTPWIKNKIVATHGMRRTHACSSEHMIQTINLIEATEIICMQHFHDLYGTVTHFSWGWLNTASYTFRVFTSWQKYMLLATSSQWQQPTVMRTTELEDLRVNLHVCVYSLCCILRICAVIVNHTFPVMSTFVDIWQSKCLFIATSKQSVSPISAFVFHQI